MCVVTGETILVSESVGQSTCAVAVEDELNDDNVDTIRHNRSAVISEVCSAHRLISVSGSRGVLETTSSSNLSADLLAANVMHLCP